MNIYFLMIYYFLLSDYPEELHDCHADYPLAPERLAVKPEDLSKTQVKMLNTLHGNEFKLEDSHEKLIPNLRNKERYILHYRNLKLYLSLGIKLTKIHRVRIYEIIAKWI